MVTEKVQHCFTDNNRQAEGEFQAQWLAIWNVDMIQDEVVSLFAIYAIGRNGTRRARTTSIKTA